MDEEDTVHIHNGILLSHKKEWNNAICSNMYMDLEGIMLSALSDRHSVSYHYYIESKK